MLKRIKNPLTAFLMGTIMFILVFLPMLIETGGVIFISGDYNMQTIPFAYHIYDAVHSGQLNWDWSTGLGSQFLSSYAYYNLFSPFTLLYFLFPRSFLIYAITIVTAVKYGVGSMLAYFYISRFVKNKHFAVIGGFVYILSSFSAYNIIFHFADVIALFPLLLIALEELCVNRRKGVFSLTVLLMAVVNYYFFFGQALFCVIYYFVRCSEIGWSWKRLFSVAGEALIGVCMSMVVLVPVAVSLLDSSKATTTLSENLFAYETIYYYLKLIQSAFMLPDPFYYVSLFPAANNEYPFGTMGASLAAYLPLFSAAGVISYMFAKKRKSWENILFAICVVMAFVPVLNQAFSAFNSGYYARWFYMPLLVAAMVSVKALDEDISYKPGLISCGAVVGLLLIYNFFFRSENEIMNYTINISAVYSSAQNLLHFGVTIISLICLIIVIHQRHTKDFIPKLYILSAVSVYTIFGVMTYSLTAIYSDYDVMAGIFAIGEEMPENVDTSERISSNADGKNISLVWGVDSTTHFNSLLDPGFDEFLQTVGIYSDKNVSRPIVSWREQICDLCSVKYHFIAVADIPDNSEYIGNYGLWCVYENENYIPMGFVFDEVISEEQYNNLDMEIEDKQALLLKYLVVENPEDYSDILTQGEDFSVISDEEYAELIEQRRSVHCTNLVKTTNGLTADINLDKENIVFFSASYNNGWSAYVDGEETDVICVDGGLIGVRVGEGEHSIELSYTTRGFKEGCIISCVGVAAFVVYIVVSRRKKSI